MVHYTPEQLLKRNGIIQSQKQFIKYLNKRMINKLINLFSGKNPKIIKYVQDERATRRLKNDTITVTSNVYGEKDDNSSFEIVIMKTNIRLLHISIHLSVSKLKPNDTGIIHIMKDIFKTAPKIIYQNKMLYALISVKQPVNKLNSLEFSIDDGYVTPSMPNRNANNTELHNELDTMIQPEMDAIIAVLNTIFDETKPEFFIGTPKNIYTIHNKTNNVLQNMNRHINHVTRKNKGNLMIKQGNIFPQQLLPRKTLKPTSRRSTRKIHRLTNKYDFNEPI